MKIDFIQPHSLNLGEDFDYVATFINGKAKPKVENYRLLIRGLITGKEYLHGVPYSASFKFSAKAGYCRSELIETEFRFCAKCFTNQIRVAHSGDEQVDWRSCQLTVDQLRDKKLSDLGI